MNEMQLPYASVWAWCDNNNSSLCDSNCNLLSKVVFVTFLITYNLPDYSS